MKGVITLQGTLKIERGNKVHENYTNDPLMNMIVGQMNYFVPKLKYHHNIG